MTQSPPAALAKVEQQIEIVAKNPAWQRLWLNLESERWQTLALIPTDNMSSLDLVHGLASVAWHQRGTRVIVADLRSIGLPSLAAARAELRRRVQSGERVLICMTSLEKNPTTATLARDADKSVLCVYRGQTLKAGVRDALRELSPQKCLGVILVNLPAIR